MSTIGVLILAGCSGQGAAADRPSAEGLLANAVVAGCEMASGLASGTPGLTIHDSTGFFLEEALPGPVHGCRLLMSGSFQATGTEPGAMDRLAAGFPARGWEELLAYGAGGVDGEAFAFRAAGVMCHVRGTWNGGADGDPGIPAEDWYTVTVLCFSPSPEEPADAPPL